MKVVYKYNLLITDMQGIYLPKNSKILCAKEQYNNVVIYVEIDNKSTEDEYVEFVIVGTGRALPKLKLQYIDTVLTAAGTLVWHVYKMIP